MRTGIWGADHLIKRFNGGTEPSAGIEVGADGQRPRVPGWSILLGCQPARMLSQLSGSVRRSTRCRIRSCGIQGCRHVGVGIRSREGEMAAPFNRVANQVGSLQVQPAAALPGEQVLEGGGMQRVGEPHSPNALHVEHSTGHAGLDICSDLSAQQGS